MNPIRREHRFSKYIRALALVSASLTMCGITVIANDIKPSHKNDAESKAEKTIEIEVPVPPSKPHDVPVTIETILQNQPDSDENINCEDLYILVSTIDGMVTALDLHNHGHMMWTVPADSHPLYSSSLANMEIIRKGKKLRVIPSLDGALYQYDGEKVEAVPMSAETLLSNTYRLSDDAMVVGSKEIRNYGIDLKTGEIQYTCGSEGCKSNAGQAEASWNNVVVLTRTTQVVRSVDIKNGVEKWNFSVGQHEVSIPQQKQRPQIDADDSDEDSDEYVTTEADGEWPWVSDQEKKCSSKFPEDRDIEDYLRLIVPEGKVIALSKEGPTAIRWEHKFESPIAKAWLLRRGKVVPMNLFDGRHLPTLGTAFEPDDLENESMHQPLLYIGSHHKHLYIQPSPKMETMLKKLSNQRVGHVFDGNVQVSWRPYLNTASVRTPIFGGNRPAIAEKPKHEKKEKSNALAVWHEDYPFDTGYFLYPDYLDGGVKKWPSLGRSRQPRLDSLADSPWSGLTLIVGYIAVITAGIFSLYFTLFRTSASLVSEPGNNNTDSASNQSETDRKFSSGDSADAKEGYTSRFATDFDCLQCLGKGGFGIVFEAVNKFDKNHYAVKRTMLPDREGAREKVLREAMCLAKLEHRGITRYFSAWVESPPPGWQAEEDKRNLANESSGTSLTTQSYSIKRVNKKQRRKQYFNEGSILPDQCKEAFLDTDSGLTESDDKSHEFSVHSSVTGKSHGCTDFEGFDSSTGSLLFSGEASNLLSNIPLQDSRSQSSKHSWSLISSQHLNDDSIVFEESNNPLPCFTSDNSNAFDYSNVTDDSIVFEESQSRGQRLPSNKDAFKYSNITDDSIVFEETGAGGDENLLADNFSYNDHTYMSSTQTSTKESNLQGYNGKQTVEISMPSYEEESSHHNKDSETKHYLYIQMQLYRKDTLKDWLTNTVSRDHNTVVNIFVQLVEAVDYLHTQRLMHRDLKPSNIFFSDDGVVKVGDFGLVTSLAVEQDDGNENISNNTRHTAEVGTTIYMSPEQISKQPYDFKVDIFSLGLIFLELCVPFSTQMERIRTILDVKRQIFPENFVSNCPVEYDLVKQMTSTISSQRPTAHDILDHELLKNFVVIGFETRRSRSRTVSNDSNS